MKWFEGSIADAVTASKSTNAVFVVFVEGSDEMSKIMSSALDSGGITTELSSSKFVCIKLTKDSESHRQFLEIYKIVPVPSLFFIGENGVPLEIVAGDNVVGNVSKKISSAISKIKGESSVAVSARDNSSSGSMIANSKPTSSVTSSTPTPSTITPTAPPEEAAAVSKPTKDESEKEKRAQELIKMKREENKKMEEEKEKERELSRRKMGKEISVAKKTQQERELEELRKERERDRKLEAEARQRVLRQIEEDKAYRASKMVQQTSSSSEQASPPRQTAEKPTLPKCQANEGRIQFKLPDGQTRTQTFPSDTTLRDLRTYVDTNMSIPFKEYLLATTFPRREFTSRDLNSDLGHLELLPSSVILILPVQGNMSLMRGPGWTATIAAMFWSMVQPLFDLGSYITSFITGRRDDNVAADASSSSSSQSSPVEQPPPIQPDQPTSSRPPYYGSLGAGKSVRRRGNIHTLSDGNDSNDENNTWNGNSTQLM